MSDVVDTATDLVADAADGVAEHAASFADAAREVSGYGLPVVLGALVVGAAGGAAGGYFFARRQLETKYLQIAEAEIEEMKHHYEAKTVALENTVAKPDLEDIVRDHGYSAEAPMAVSPPAAVVEAAAAAAEEDQVEETPELPPNDDELEGEPEVQNIFERDEPQETRGWDHHAERARRSPVRPYVIHEDEKDEFQHYDSITWTLYEGDDVLCNETDEVIAGNDRERLVGEANLDRFGHGTDDPNTVFIRNDQMQTVIEVVKSPNSYAEEVHGFRHADDYPRRRTRRSFDDG